MQPVIKWGPFIILLRIIYEGYREIDKENHFPTPTEWSFWARWHARRANIAMDAYEDSGWLTLQIWGFAQRHLLEVITRLEDQSKDGKGIHDQGDDGKGVTFVETVGKLGYDISAKSTVWKQAYGNMLMALATSAENLDGRCRRKGEALDATKLFRWENIPGPDNPRPIPASWEKDGSHLKVPQLHEVEAASEPAEAIYLKILTTKGFTNRQRLDAALACADWMQFKGLKSTASSMYDWALDIAAGGLPEGADHVVDIQTGVINAGKDAFVTDNLLRATTALAVWHARNGEVQQALPIFLSVLRARKALPAGPDSNLYMGNSSSKVASGTEGAVDAAASFIRFFANTENTIIHNSGDEQPFHSLKEACEEVGLMTYIGEILFATSEQEREKGLSWTRDSVDAAEAILWFMDEKTDGQSQEGRKRCKECLETGLRNWQQMVKQMTTLAKQKEQEANQSSGWLGLGIGTASQKEKAAATVKKWEEEEIEIELKIKKVSTFLDPRNAAGNPFVASASNVTI